ncbi:50S ribosomal protein L11 methyltransferase [Streptomyces benahoarensis]|uniref:Protein arginine N-methyltransferase domain-containing protein n=1 Tax=Streptomyces benahoarensis TaxID=2595054 RepID=A0A553ZNJ4_9ACTN|nr:50S ribosomal protein L11 methyltransferase [Streptomyces benahoarensis]TSB26002.1 hypothetical protein FNJ62_11720 [Streptomyces benahoarensis]TSB43038.1 hypothetical protein FNZ23_06610 [Streptomyces benahoarensis]
MVTTINTPTDGFPPGVSLANAPSPIRGESPELRLALASLQAQAQTLNELIRTTVDALASPQAAPVPGTRAFAEIAQRTVPRWHFAMLNDTARNEALATAVRRAIPPGATVLDIGSGTGLLAMAAVRAGAAHVYTCEGNPLLAEIARQIIAEHGMSDSITVLTKFSTAIEVGRDLPRRADVLISEIVDCGLIGEGLLPTVRHAREHLLAPGGVMMPVSARLHGQLVDSPAMVNLNRVHEAHGFDVSLMETVATRGHFPVRMHTWPHRLLSDPFEMVAFDLAHDPLLPGSRRLTVPVTTDGRAHGLLSWFSLKLYDGLDLCNAPDNPESHWMQALLLFDKPASVTAGESLDMELRWTETQLTVV